MTRWEQESEGYDFRTGIEGGEPWLGVTHLIFADKYCLMAENKAMLTDMVRRATVLRCGFEWKNEEMQHAC